MHYKSYSPELRERICTLLDTSTHSRAEVSRIFDIPYSTVCDIYDAYCENANTVQLPKPKGRKRKILNEEDINCIQTIVNENCARTLQEIADKLFERRQKKVCLETIRQALDSFRYSLKRIYSIPQIAESPELRQERVEYADWFLKSNYQQGKVIFLDETGFLVSMRRTRGISKRGTAPRLIVPAKKARNISVIAAISFTNLVHYKVLNGSDNATNFVAFLNEIFARLPEPGYILVMDSARFHLSPDVQKAVQAAGHSIKYLPAYSTSFNPVELLFSQWENFVTAAAPMDEPHLLGAIGTVDQRVTAEHIHNYFTHIRNNCHKSNSIELSVF